MCCASVRSSEWKLSRFPQPAWQILKTQRTSQLHKKYLEALDWGLALTSHSAALHYIIFTLVCVFTALKRRVGYIFTRAPTHCRLASEIRIHQANTRGNLNFCKSRQMILRICGRLTYSAKKKDPRRVPQKSSSQYNPDAPARLWRALFKMFTRKERKQLARMIQNRGRRTTR